MVAPAIGGVLTSDGGYQSILWVGGAAALIALTISLLALRMGLGLAQEMREKLGLELPDSIL